MLNIHIKNLQGIVWYLDHLFGDQILFVCWVYLGVVGCELVIQLRDSLMAILTTAVILKMSTDQLDEMSMLVIILSGCVIQKTHLIVYLQS